MSSVTNYLAVQGDPNRFVDEPPPFGGSGSGIGLVVAGLLLRLRHRLVELLGVQPGIVERVAPAPVRQGQLGGHPDVLFVDGVRSAPRRVRDRGARHHQIGAHPVDVECRAQRGDAA